ncbi:oligosaccharide flippase family protein [Vibrio diabolicus]|uniref:oligosaccharide flippase family protein n=1 Tax=Vibrio diabolicus TaxID=50719 RepID=UPI00215F4925|nr:oligosaccharide flippase family protein [Vibrio diabolicus]MCS0305986.1 oligosaccharide flippase family protein [Vibrio diabolicus]MCS0404657.1 oligosaccharide flippase family protein [Vibrio diabolicus]
MSIEKRAFKGAFSLSLLKAIDYIVPLVLVPYVIHVLGLEFYGEYAYIQVIAIFLAFAADYSLPTVGVQNISKRKNRAYIHDYVSSLVIFKLFNVLVITIILLCTILIFGIKIDVLEWCGFFIYLGLSIQNHWLYQSFEKYKPLIIFSGTSRFACLVITPFLVRTAEDQNEFLSIQALMYFLPGILSLVYYFYNFSYTKVKARYIYHIMKEGFYVFQYRIINAAVLPINNQVIVMYADTKTLGVYNLIMKGLSALVNFITPLSLSVQPILAEMKSKSAKDLALFFNNTQNKILFISSILTAILCVSLIMYLSYYNEMGDDNSLYILTGVLSLTLIPHALNGLYSQTLNLFGSSKFVRNVILFVSLFSLSILPIMVMQMQAVGIAFVNFFMYFTMLVLMFFKLGKNFEK